MKRIFVFVFFFLNATFYLAQDFYKDKLVFLNFNQIETKDSNTKIDSLLSQNYDAVILSSEFSEELLNNSFTSSSVFKFLKNNSDFIEKNQLRSIIEIDFAPLKNFNAEKLLTLKKNIKAFTEQVVFSGFLFSNINLADDEQFNLFENIVVEAILVKPYLLTSVNEKSFSLNQNAVSNLIENGIVDFVIQKENNVGILKNSFIQADEKILSTYLKRISPEHFVKLNLEKLIDNENSVFKILKDNHTKKIDASKKVNFILTGKTDTIKFLLNDKSFSLATNFWVIPFNYLIEKDGSQSRYGNWIEFRRPFDKKTFSSTYNLLCKTQFPAEVKINGEQVKIYKTGVFFKKINLNVGLNKLTAEAKDKNGNLVIYEDQVLYQRKNESEKYFQLAIDEESIQPNENLTLLNKDFLTISFNGTKGQTASVEFSPSNLSHDLLRKDFTNYSHYEIQIPLSDFPLNEKQTIKLIIKSSESKIEKQLKNTIEVKSIEDFPLLITNQDYSILTYTLAPIRLGAPLRNELPKDVILKSNGLIGNNYRIQLSETEEGYISNEFVNELPKGNAQPTFYINPISAFPDQNYDVVRIPYLENVPFDIYPDPYQKRITINLYGVKTSSTWIIHKSNLRYVEEVTWQQTSKETYKIYVNLNTNKIWGYELKQNGKELLLKIKYPPIYNLKSKLPLKGIKISIEAGHGGSNTGAIGLSGLKEKEINLALSKKLEALFKKNGAEVFMVRDTDKDMTLLEKRTLAINSNANIHFSIHANSSAPENEFLGTNGTCTFYNNPFWAPFAEKVFYKLIELYLAPFGSVGSFNYRVIRINEMPSILVEQAFMSHAEDEEKLADENFRDKMAKKIFEGLIEYLKFMQN